MVARCDVCGKHLYAVQDSKGNRFWVAHDGTTGHEENLGAQARQS